MLRVEEQGINSADDRQSMSVQRQICECTDKQAGVCDAQVGHKCRVAEEKWLVLVRNDQVQCEDFVRSGLDERVLTSNGLRPSEDPAIGRGQLAKCTVYNAKKCTVDAYIVSMCSCPNENSESPSSYV